jgi:hypothetical protein
VVGTFIPGRKRYLQLPGGYSSIFKEEFVEIAHAEKQQGVRVLPLGGAYWRRSGVVVASAAGAGGRVDTENASIS